MSVRRLAVLAAVLAVAGLYYYIVEVRVAGAKATREAEAKQLFHFTTDAAAFLEWRRPEETIRLAKREGRWHVTTPVDERADESTVSSVLSTMAALTPTRAFDDAGPLEDYGLAPPELTVQVQDRDGNTLAVLDVGNANPDSRRRFVRDRESPTVGLVTKLNYDTLAKTLLHLRTKQWSTLALGDVHTVRFQRAADLHVQVKKTEDGQWTLDGVSPKAANAIEVQSLLSRVLATRIVEVVTDTATAADVTQYGLDAPAFVLTLQDGIGETQLRVGATLPEVTPARRYAAVQGDARILVFNAGVFDGFPATADDLRDRTLLRFARAAVDRITLTHQAATVAVMRDPAEEGAWILDDAETVRADEVEVGALVGRLERLVASGFLGLGDVPVQPADFEAAAVTVQIGLTAAPHTLRVRFAQGAASDTWYALRDGDSEVYPVENKTVQSFQLTREVLRDKHLVRFDAGAVHRIELQFEGRAGAYTRRGDDAWYAGPGVPALDTAEVEQLLRDVADLRYTRLLPDDTPPVATKPAFAVTLRDIAGAELATVRVGGTLDAEDGVLERTATAGDVVAAIDGRIVSDWVLRLGR